MAQVNKNIDLIPLSSEMMTFPLTKLTKYIIRKDLNEVFVFFQS